MPKLERRGATRETALDKSMPLAFFDPAIQKALENHFPPTDKTPPERLSVPIAIFFAALGFNHVGKSDLPKPSFRTAYLVSPKGAAAVLSAVTDYKFDHLDPKQWPFWRKLSFYEGTHLSRNSGAIPSWKQVEWMLNTSGLAKNGEAYIRKEFKLEKERRRRILQLWQRHIKAFWSNIHPVTRDAQKQ